MILDNRNCSVFGNSVAKDLDLDGFVAWPCGSGSAPEMLIRIWDGNVCVVLAMGAGSVS